MTPEEQRIAIAEACGWTDISEPYSNEFEWTGIFRSLFRAPIPDYLNDLNAMHEAEKMFRNAIYCRYISELCDLAIKDNNCMYMATAAQRAEAFLKTLNLWKP